jgi:hypothetical protein
MYDCTVHRSPASGACTSRRSRAASAPHVDEVLNHGTGASREALHPALERRVLVAVDEDCAGGAGIEDLFVAAGIAAADGWEWLGWQVGDDGEQATASRAAEHVLDAQAAVLDVLRKQSSHLVGVVMVVPLVESTEVDDRRDGESAGVPQRVLDGFWGCGHRQVLVDDLSHVGQHGSQVGGETLDVRVAGCAGEQPVDFSPPKVVSQQQLAQLQPLMEVHPGHRTSQRCRVRMRVILGPRTIVAATGGERIGLTLAPIGRCGGSHSADVARSSKSADRPMVPRR